ncbi:hypothetical protein WN944_009442 [Citrus x changshan-huyou]|uniref:KIB1-4 beta-propeller domain-containing protein n=1 Tax=Citrus x changshan-huyou TaxID=2935761 RepID=A0AAP0MPS3_9ROSI
MANWSELHHDLLVEIAGQIKLYEDFVSFRWVCTSWRWAAAIKKFMYKFNQMPLLMHMPLNCGDINQRGFFSLSRGMSRRILLPEANSHRNCLSSKGWLLRLHVQNLNASLLNPFSRVQLELPNIRTFMPWEYCVDHPFFFKKFVVSASNLERHSDYTVMVICGSERTLAYFKPGQETWITVDTGNWYRFHDVIYHKGRFYAINWLGYIFVCDFTGHVPNNLIVVARMSISLLMSSSMLYLVESGGALVVVMRSRANKFQVFEVDLTTNTWTKVKDLGNRALFLEHGNL